MAKRTKLDIYRDALINIWFTSGTCWDGNRECSDPQATAGLAIKQADPGLHAELEATPYRQVKVNRDGSVSYKRPTKQ